MRWQGLWAHRPLVVATTTIGKFGNGFFRTQWEVTIAEALSDAGYATAAFGKWNLGSSQGLLPSAQGFDEWSMFPAQPGAVASGMPFMHTMEGRKGETSRELVAYDLEQRRLIDTEIARRTMQAHLGRGFRMSGLMWLGIVIATFLRIVATLSGYARTLGRSMGMNAAMLSALAPDLARVER